MKRVYTSPNINGVYVLDYSSAQAKGKKGGLSGATTGGDTDLDTEAARKEGYQRGFNDAMKDAEAAKQESYRRGMTDGGKQSEDKLSTAFRTMQEAVSALQSEKEDVWKKSEIEIIKLVLAITHKVVGYEISNSDNLIEKVVADAITHAGKHKIVSIRMNPADAAKLNEAKIKTGPNDTFSIVEDPKLSPGGCVVETDFGSIDAQLETRIDNVINQILTHPEPGDQALGAEPAPES